VAKVLLKIAHVRGERATVDYQHGRFASSPTLLTGFFGLRQTKQTRENDNPRIQTDPVPANHSRQGVSDPGF
jgi:hypothetical protein